MRQIKSLSNKANIYTENVKVALKNGCQWVQLRMQEVADEDFVSVALTVRELCDKYHAYLIIEDCVHLVKQVNANGVLLNKKEEVGAARKQLGARYLICVKADDTNEARRFHRMGADCTNEAALGLKTFEMVVDSSYEVA